ncbi:MAG: thioredoxin family protein [Phaeodactylibacter sp.]|nr:thioredoxin family protein [Phaeodactylibacter sp.]
MLRNILLSIGISLLLPASLSAQEKESIHWLSFEQLEDALMVQPKRVFIDFHTDWCAYCHKMDKAVFTKREVIELLNEEYYAVRFDAEIDSVVTFGGREFINDQVGQSRNPLHQIAQLLAIRDGQFVAPTMVLLDKEFNVTARYFQYLDSKELLKVLMR